MSDTLPTGQLSNVPWRRTGVKYTNNEAYFDVVEEIDVIIDKSGSSVFAEIQGYVSPFYHLHRGYVSLFYHLDTGLCKPASPLRYRIIQVHFTT